MKTTTARIAAIAAITALGLTACGGDTRAADAGGTTPASAGPTSPPSPTANTNTTAPPGQPATRASQEATAIALVRTYVDEYNKALKSGSTTAFRETFKETCAFCFGDANRIDATFRKHQQLRGLRLAVTSLHVSLHDSRQVWVEGQVSQAGGKVLSDSGVVAKSFKQTRAYRFLWRVKPGAPSLIFGSDKL